MGNNKKQGKLYSKPLKSLGGEEVVQGEAENETGWKSSGTHEAEDNVPQGKQGNKVESSIMNN